MSISAYLNQTAAWSWSVMFAQMLFSQYIRMIQITAGCGAFTTLFRLIKICGYTSIFLHHFHKLLWLPGCLIGWWNPRQMGSVLGGENLPLGEQILFCRSWHPWRWAARMKVPELFSESESIRHKQYQTGLYHHLAFRFDKVVRKKGIPYYINIACTICAPIGVLEPSAGAHMVQQAQILPCILSLQGRRNGPKEA